MRTVLVTPELPIKTGGIGTFIWTFSQLLRGASHDVHILFTHPTDQPRKRWATQFENIGVTLSWVHASPMITPPGYSWHMKAAEAAADMIPPDADVIYFADWQAMGVHYVRGQRFRGGFHPVTATVLHSSSKWLREAMREWPATFEEQWLDFSEAYMTQHSDFVVSPSRYLLDWVKRNDWVVPPEERQRVLGLPFFPPRLPTVRPLEAARPGSAPPRFKRVAFFGRIETRKGIDLFVEALGRLRGQPCMRGVEEIVLLGSVASNPYGNAADIVAAVRARVGEGLRVEALTDKNTFEAQSYLAERVDDTLVVIPSRLENFSLAVIEMSLIPRMNLICSNAGAIPEILGEAGRRQLFAPFLGSLTHKIEETLLAGPQPEAARGRYDWQAANQAWLDFHEEACALARSRREELRAERIALPTVALAPAAPPAAALAAVPAPGAMTASGGATSGSARAVAGDGHEAMQAMPGRRAVRTLAASEPARAAAPESQGDPIASRSVDVCITYYNLPAYLPYLLDSLAKQTSQDFNLFVVNDGSTDPKANAAFDRLKDYHARDGWHFVTVPNRGLSAARNHAASLGRADYLIFMDADNIAAPNMVERFLDGIRRSGDDCLTCYMYHFGGEGTPYSSTGILQPTTYLYAPIGASPLLNVMRNEYGDANGIVRRAAFEAVGGFTGDVHKSLTGEDWELFVQLSLGGYKMDVIPEFLAFYRVREESLYRTTETFLNNARVLRQYERRLRAVGLEGLASFVAGRASRAQQGAGAANADMAYLVNQVSGYKIVKALRIKLRNQIARRLGRPLVYS